MMVYMRSGYDVLLWSLTQCKVILAASNDNTARLWSISEGRSKVGVVTAE